MLLCAWVSYVLCDWFFDREKLGFKLRSSVRHFVCVIICSSHDFGQKPSTTSLNIVTITGHQTVSLSVRFFSKANSWLNKKSNWKPNKIFVVANAMIYRIILFICYVSLTVITKNYRKFWFKPSKFLYFNYVLLFRYLFKTK